MRRQPALHLGQVISDFLMSGNLPPRLGAAHGMEIPFVFDTLGLGTEPLLGRDPPQSLPDVMMHEVWVAFAGDGDCGWPKYDIARRPTMRFDTTSKVADDSTTVELALERRAVINCLRRCEAVTQIPPPSQVG